MSSFADCHCLALHQMNTSKIHLPICFSQYTRYYRNPNICGHAASCVGYLFSVLMCCCKYQNCWNLVMCPIGLHFCNLVYVRLTDVFGSRVTTGTSSPPTRTQSRRWSSTLPCRQRLFSLSASWASFSTGGARGASWVSPMSSRWISLTPRAAWRSSPRWPPGRLRGYQAPAPTCLTASS